MRKYYLSLLAPALLLTAGCIDTIDKESMDPDPNEQPATTSSNTAPDVSLASIGMTEDGWYQSYQQAMAKAKETGKPVMVDFTGSDWCGWCIKLHDEVFSKEEFQQWAKDNVVLLELDYPQSVPQPASLKEQNQELAQKFEIRGYPTVLFLDAEENVLGRYGYDEGGPENWIAKAEAKIAGN